MLHLQHRVNVFHLKDLFDVARELDVKSYFKFTFAFDPSVVMSPMCLPKEVSKPWCEELISYFDKNRTWKNKVYAESLRNLINRHLMKSRRYISRWTKTWKRISRILG